MVEMQGDETYATLTTGGRSLVLSVPTDQVETVQVQVSPTTVTVLFEDEMDRRIAFGRALGSTILGADNPRLYGKGTWRGGKGGPKGGKGGPKGGGGGGHDGDDGYGGDHGLSLTPPELGHDGDEEGGRARSRSSRGTSSGKGSAKGLSKSTVHLDDDSE